MSGPFGSSQWMYSSGAEFYDFPIEQSLKFNDNDSSYLSWTPASAGNRKTWTWSGWVKRGNISLSAPATLFSAGTGGSGDSARLCLQFKQDDTLITDMGGIGQYNQSNSVYRDTSAWYHIVWKFDVTQSTAADRSILYVNGERISDQNLRSFTQNADHQVNAATVHRMGALTNVLTHWADLYLAEVNFIDGQALDPTSFGEFKSGVWIPKDPSGLTYGTNGFRLSFQNDTVSEGFNTVTFSSDGSAGSVSGLGFSPDFVWAKSRTNADGHELWDTVRGTSSTLFSNVTEAQDTSTGRIVSFDADGFSYGTNGNMQTAGNFVAWCWDAGSGSPVSNTDGSITSTVKANTAYGMSIVTWTGTGSSSTVGHGLSSTPELIINKNRSAVENWVVYNPAQPNGTQYLRLNQNTALTTDSSVFGAAPTSSVFTVGTNPEGNGNGNNHVAYCFHSVTGYSKVGSYSGSGATGNAITTGFKPAFVMIKRSNNVGNWVMWDNTRDTTNPNQYPLYPNLSNAESFEPTDRNIQFDSNGFTLLDGNNDHNASGGTYIYLAFADTRDNAFWRDQSGNGNDWQPNNLTYQDSLLDAPTNNFAVLNAIWQGSANQAPLSEGNLQANSSGEQATFAIPSSGKWYWEVDIRNSNGYTGIGFTNGPYSQYLRWNVAYGSFTNASAGTLNVGTQSSYADCLVMIAWDADNDEFYMGVNGSWFGGGNPAAGTNSTLTLNTSSTGIWIPEHNLFNGGTAVYNFGQDSSFAGIKAAQGNTDDNGIGDFYYAPPSGYLALCTANLPDPVIDPAKDDVPSDYFNTVTYNNTGTSYPKSVTGIGFQPDLIWVKSRTQAYDHYLFDAVRGTGAKKLSSNTTAAEGSDSTSISSFDSDGYTISSGAGIGDITGVTWSWLAGNGTSSNTSGSITSTVSVNQKAGFSIVSYIGTGANATVGHGLGAAPSMIILKNRDASWAHWGVYHKDQGAVGSGHLYSNALNLNVAVSLSSIYWNNTAPTSSVFSIGTDGVTNNSGDDYIAYCFAEVEGYSKFGSYTGNGSTDGPMLYLGFEPAFFLAKRTDGVENWFMIDNARHPYNDGNIPRLLPNTADAESEDASIAGDFLSNGFKIRATQNMINTSGANYIYMAFAESPFKYSNAR